VNSRTPRLQQQINIRLCAKPRKKSSDLGAGGWPPRVPARPEKSASFDLVSTTLRQVPGEASGHLQN
jgi:hypothetical protein